MPKFNTILVVDDSDLDRETLARCIKKHGYNVITAEDGMQALQMAKDIKPNCIFLDIVMPGISGLEVMRSMHEDPATSNIPVVLCTTKGLRADKMWGMRNGASEYIVKPINETDVLNAIKKLEESE